MGKQVVTEILQGVYRCLLDHYGPQHWWPAESPLEVIVGAILTQSSAWCNVEKAIKNLKANDTLSPAALRQLPTEQLGQLIHPSGYYNAKAVKIKFFVHWLGDHYDDSLDRLFSLDTPLLRQQLLSVRGIGEETADSIILYAAHKPIFVIDAYTRRIIHRLGIALPSNSYASFQTLFMQHLPHREPLFNEYHALFVQHGKTACKRTPRCEGCCLTRFCVFPGRDPDWRD